MRKKRYTIEHATTINASAKLVWGHIIELDIASFQHPAYFSLLGIPKPLRAQVIEPGVGGKRIAFFSNGLRFSQTITEWRLHEQYAFTFEADPGFRVAYMLDLSDGPFQMKSGAYRITATETGVQLVLSSQYALTGFAGVILYLPVRLVLDLFQRYLLRGIKANAERQEIRVSGEHDA